MNDDKNKRRLYDALIQDYELGSFEQFSTDVEDEVKRRKLYDAIKDEYDLPDFDGFTSQLIGQPTAEAAPESVGTGQSEGVGSNQNTQGSRESGEAARYGMAQRPYAPIYDFGGEMPSVRPPRVAVGESKADGEIGSQEVQNGASRGEEQQSSAMPAQETTTTPAAEEQKEEQPTALGPERFAKSMQMQQQVAKMQQDFSEQMENIRRSNQPFGDKPEDVFAPVRKAKAQREAEERAQKDIELATMEMRQNDAAVRQTWAAALGRAGEQWQFGRPISNEAARLKETDIDKLMDEAWERMDSGLKERSIKKVAHALVEDYGMRRDEARQMAERVVRGESDRMMYEQAVQGNMPRSWAEHILNKVNGNTIGTLLEGWARSKAGTIGDLQARDEASQAYGKEHRVADIIGGVGSVALDAGTIMAGGAGAGAGAAVGAGARATAMAVGRKAGLKAMGRAMTAGKVAQGMAAGAANLAAFEAMGEGANQVKYGGKVMVDEESGRYVIPGYDAGEILSAAGRGALLGVGTGAAGAMIGNVGGKIYERVSSTAGKIGVRAGQTATSIAVEGTIFAMPEFMEGNGDWDTWLESVEMMAGFKVHGAVKSVRSTIEQLKKKPESRAGFETRLRTMLDGEPSLRMTDDEIAELEQNGYADLAEMVKGYKEASQSQREAIEKKQPIYLEPNEEGEVPYNRFLELMEDNQISEAARAKMHYYVSGHKMPMSTVIGTTFTEHADENGNVTGYTVEALGEGGKVIVSRRYKSLKEAEVARDRYNRQAELNGIKMAEGVHDQLHEKMEDGITAEAVRKGVSEEYGVDVDKAIGKEPNRRSDAEKKAIEEYLRRLARIEEKDVSLQPERQLPYNEDTSSTEEDSGLGVRPDTPAEESAEAGGGDGSPDTFTGTNTSERVYNGKEEGVQSTSIAGHTDIDEERLQPRRFRDNEGDSYTDQQAFGHQVIERSKEEGLYIDPATLDSYGERVSGHTGESVVYRNEAERRVVKVKDPFAKAPMKGNATSDALYEHLVHNLLFPEDGYRLLGVTEENGEMRLVLEQPFVESERKASKKEIERYLTEELGLQKEGKYWYGNDLLSITDVEAGSDNVIVDSEGRLHFIDPIIKLKVPARDILRMEDGEETLPEEPIETVPEYKEAYERGYWTDEQGRRDIAIELAMADEGNREERLIAWNGVIHRIVDEAKEAARAEREAMAQQVHTASNTVRRVVLKEQDEKGKDKEAYVVDGNVVMMADGTMVDPEASDRTVVIYDPVTGEKRMIDPTSGMGVLTADEPVGMDAVEAEIESRRQARIRAGLDAANGKVSVEVGQSLRLPDGRDVVVVSEVDESGVFMVQNSDGARLPVRIEDIQKAADAAAMADYMERHPQPTAETEAPAAEGQEGSASTATPNEAAERPEGFVEGAPTEYMPDMEITIRDDEGNEQTATVMGRVRSENFQYVPDENGGIVEYMVEGQVRHDNIGDLAERTVGYVERDTAVPESTATEQREDAAPKGAATEQPIEGELDNRSGQSNLNEQSREQNAEDAMPVREDGEADFMATTPERGHRYIYDEAGLSRDEAGQFVKANIDEAEKALKKIQGKAPKMGTSLQKYQQEKTAHEQQVAAAQVVLDYWNGVKAEQQRVVAAERQAQAERDAAAHEAAVAAEQARQAAEIAKQQEQAERGANAVHPAIREKWEAAQKIDGVENEITLPNGEKIKGHYVLVESGAATPSHKPNMEFARNEGFPVDENGQTVNDRDYERDLEAQQITREMASRYDSRAIQSVPVVSRDGVVLSGNGRTMAGELAAQQGTDGDYISHLKRYPQQFGFTSEQVESMQHPRVLFVADEEMPYTTETFAKFNAQDMKSQSRTEQAVKLGKTVDDATFARVVSSINRFDTLGDFYNDPKAASTAIGELYNAGAINQMQLAEMMDGERVSGIGRQMLENMLIGKAFESNPEAVRQLAEYPAMRQSVVAALAELANNIKLGEEYSLADELSQAISLAYRARKAGTGAGERVSWFARQQNLFTFDEGETVADYTNLTMLMLADMVNDSRTNQLKKTLALYNDKAAASAAGQVDMFSGGVKSKEEILKDIFELLNYGTENEKREALAGAAERRKEAAGDAESEPIGGSDEGGEGRGDRQLDERQGNLSQTQGLNYQLSDEVDENGRQFVLTNNGDLEFGVISADTGLTPAPILLSEGVITNPVTNDGYGLVHIEARHGDEIRRAGYSSVIDFIEEVAKNYEVIREGKNRDGIQTYMLQLTDKHNNTLMVELSGDGTYWNINTAGIFKTSYGAKRDVVYNRHTTDNQSAETDVASLSGEQGGTTPSTSMDATAQTSDNGNTLQTAALKPHGEAASSSGKSTKKSESGQINNVSGSNTEFEYTTEEAYEEYVDALNVEQQPLEDRKAGLLRDRGELADRMSAAGKKSAQYKELQEQLKEIDKKIAGLDAKIDEFEGKIAEAAKKRMNYLRQHGMHETLDEEGRNGQNIEDGAAPEGAATEQPTEEASEGAATRHEKPLSLEDMREVSGREKQAHDSERTEETAPEGADTEQREDAAPKGAATEQHIEEAPKDADTEQRKGDDGYGAKNRFVNRERYEELKRRMRELNSRLNSGIDPERLAVGVEMAAYHIEAGARKFADFAKRMIEDLGDVIRPYLKAFYNGARDMPEMAEYEKEMTPYDEVRSFDTLNFDKKGAKDLIATAENITAEQTHAEEAKVATTEIKKKRAERQKAKKDVNLQSQMSLFGEEQGEAAAPKGADTEQSVPKKSEVVDEETAKVRRAFSEAVMADMLDAIERGEKPYRSIVDIRKRAERVGMKVDSDGRDDILLQELVEDGLVRAARTMIESRRYGGSKSRTAYEAICKLYDMQPTIAQRSSNRIKMQQYSTPLPMAFAADLFAYEPGEMVLEPTAGNGMLVFGVPAKQVVVNELDKTRLDNLRAQGFNIVSSLDASVHPDDAGRKYFGGPYGAVIANPPFGSAPARLYDGKSISGLDQQIALNALMHMHPEGRAAIIIGGNMEYASNGSVKDNKAFWSYLYDHYNVKGVVDMSGKLYAKQGTTYPTRMILIDGMRSDEERAQSTVYPPVKEKAIRKVENFEELYDTVKELTLSKEKTNGTEILRTSSMPIVPNTDEGGRSINTVDTDREHHANDGDGRDGRTRPTDGTGSRGGDRTDEPRRVPGPAKQSESGVEQSGDAGVHGEETHTGGRPISEGEHGGSGRRGDNGRVDDEGVRAMGDARRGVGLRTEEEQKEAQGGSTTQQDKAIGQQAQGAIEQSGGERPNTARAKEAKPQEKRTFEDEKLAYRPHNRAFSLESVAPAAMVEAMDRTLTEIERVHGKSIDDFVTQELGYDSVEEMHNALAAEQADSVAMAIHQMIQGKSLIIGDQTGVGKGRQMAALIRWAVKQWKKPIFITQKADLFSDIYRDLVDVGSGDLRPFIFNSDGAIVDGNGKTVHKPLSNAQQEKIFASGELPEGYDFAVLTYSQVNTGDKISRESRGSDGKRLSKGKSANKDNRDKPSPKADFLRKIANDNYLFLDESHTAAGESNTGAYIRSIIGSRADAKIGRGGARAVAFASATFAKRPDTMPMYALRTAMSEANVEPDKLIGIIEKGGVTLQEIMSRALTESGQMVRRERDMSDVRTDWETISDPATVQRARENYDKTIEAFNAIIRFQEEYVKPMIDALSGALAETMKTAKVKKGTKKMGVENVPFASKTYNYTKQLMLALKTDAIVDRIEAEIKAGRHPVIALESTMEASLKDYAAGEEIVEPTFSASLLRGLETVMQYTVKDENGKESHERYTPSQLGAEGERAYYQLQNFIEEATKGVYISPLDAIIDKLHERGYKVGEMTGRSLYAERDSEGRVVVRKRTDKDKKRMQREFNSGVLDVLILNKSASTGISLHASERFSDQRQRSMIIAQPLSDINDYMQMIGRIDRTGQVARGYYVNLGLPVPAENRFMMMLSTKLKSLNANTTTSQESESSSVEAPDLLNKYGSQVVVEYLRDNPDIYAKMGDPLKLRDEKTAGKSLEELLDGVKPGSDDAIARKITGYVALLNTAEQEAFYNDVVQRYSDLIKYLDDTGTNDLKITVMPLKAKTIKKKVSSEGKAPDGNNPFAGNAYVEEVEMDVLRKPMKAADVKKTIDQLNAATGAEKGHFPHSGHDRMATERVLEIVGQVQSETAAKLQAEDERYERSKQKAQADYERYQERIMGQNRSEAEKLTAIERYRDDLNANVERRHNANVNILQSKESQMMRGLSAFVAGRAYLLPQNMSEQEQGQATVFKTAAIFCGYKVKKNGLTPSTSFAVFATLDGRRRVEVKLGDNAAIKTIEFLTNANWDEARNITLENWDSKAPTETRKKGYIMTGNILQAVADTQRENGSYPGQLISYSDHEGNIHDGILMPDGWEPNMLKTSGVPIEGAMGRIRKYDTIESTDGKVKLSGIRNYNEYYLEVPKTKKEGAAYFDNDVILQSTNRRDGFYPYRGKLRADIPAENIEEVVKELGRLGVRVKGEEGADDVRFRMVEDDELVERLESEPTEVGYRNVVLNEDGSMGSPMASKLGKRGAGRTATSGFEFDRWEQADENPDMATDEGKIDLIKPDGKSVGGVDYNPYIHIRPTLVNKQFKQAWERPNLVYVETQYPASELTSGYKADKAKKSVGRHDWNGGELILSRWDKPTRIVPWEQVADDWMKEFGERGVEFDIVPPRLLPILAERGVEILPPHKGMGKACTEAYERWQADPEGYYGDMKRTEAMREGDIEGGDTAYGDWFDGGSVERIGAFMGYSRKRIDAAKERKKESAKNVFREKAEKLHLDDKIEFLDDDSKLTGRYKVKKGWYDPRTGKITIVLGNHKSMDDVMKSMMHEGVAHHGLREMFGEEFDHFLDQVYEYADEGIRRRIIELAGKHGWDFRTATEEYLAGLAEDTDFEKPENQSWWSKVKNLFHAMFQKMLGWLRWKDKDVEVELTDNELRYILWASYENLKEPGRYSYVREAADVAKRAELKVGEYAEDVRRERRTTGQNEWWEHSVAEDNRSDNMTQEGDNEGVLFREGADDDIPRAVARESYERMMQSGMNQFKEAVQDSMLGLRRAYEAILEAEGKGKVKIEEVKGYENAYLAENRMASSSEAEIRAWQKDHMEPLTRAIYALAGRDKEAYNELVDYMMAKHGLERNEVFAERDAQRAADEGKDHDEEYAKNRGRDYAGLTALTGLEDVADAELSAMQMVDDYEASHDKDAIDELWEAVNRATESSLRKTADSGLMSAERFRQVRDMFEYYIPLQGFDSAVAEDVYAYMGSDGTKGYGTPIRSAKGRKSKSDDPIATISMNGEAAIRRGNRNLMKQHFLRFVEQHPSDLVSVSEVWLEHDDVNDEWRQIGPELNESDSASEVAQKVEAFEERMKQLSESDPDHYKRGRDLPNVPYRVLKSTDMNQHQVAVQKAGRTVIMTINGNPRAAQALNGLTNPDVFTEGAFGKVMNAGQRFNRQLSLFYTTRNPEFVLSNFLRDAIYSNSMAWVKESPNYALKFHKNFGKMNPVHMGRLFGEWESGTLRKKIVDGVASATEKMFYDFMKNGGETGWTNLRDIEKHKRDLEKKLRREGNVSAKVWKALGGCFDLMNRSVENCARFAAYVTSREMGRSVERSIWDAKEVSVNFNKKGAGDKFLTAKGQKAIGVVGATTGGFGRGLYVFFNASLQGLNNIARATKRHPWKVAGLFGTLFSLGAVIPLLSALIGGDDDEEDKDSYYNLPEYVRRSNLCFRWRSDMPWITIPLPIEYRAVYGLGELAAGMLTGNERYSDEEAGRQMVSQISQVLPLDFMEGGGGWHAFVPSQLKPMVEANNNKSWTGLPIYRDNKYTPYMPQWTRAYASANQQIVEGTRWLNEATGGDDVTQGYIDWNPAKIEYMLKGYLGGYFTMYDRLQKTGETILGQREFEWRNIPMASRVLKEGDERTLARKITNEYFNLLEEYKKTDARLKGYKKIAEGEGESALEYAERIDWMHRSKEYTHYLIMDAYKPVFDAYYKLGKEAAGEDKVRLKAAENALRRECIEMIHAIDGGAEVDIDAEIERVLNAILADEETEAEVAKGVQKAYKKMQKRGQEE